MLFLTGLNYGFFEGADATILNAVPCDAATHITRDAHPSAVVPPCCIPVAMGLRVQVEVALTVLEGVPDGVAVLLTDVVGDGDAATKKEKKHQACAICCIGQ